MHIVYLTALRPLRGDFGTLARPRDLSARVVSEGGAFTTDNIHGESLEAAGLAERYRAPRAPEPPKAAIIPENKMLPAAPENKAPADPLEAPPLFCAPAPVARIARRHRR